MINHSISLDISGYAPNYIQEFELPVLAKRIKSISVFAGHDHSGTYANSYQAELILNDDRNHIIVPIQVTGRLIPGPLHVYHFGDKINYENFSGMMNVDIELIQGAHHTVLLTGISKATLHLILETCHDEPQSEQPSATEGTIISLT